MHYLAVRKPVGSATLVVETRPWPACGPHQVVARIVYAGVCTTDLQILWGERPLEPEILGHECVARVTECGAYVQGVVPGDLVAINPNNLEDCSHKIGHTEPGFFQQVYRFDDILIQRGQVVHLPPPARTEWVLLEPLACVLRAQAMFTGPIRGRRILVVGAGVTGLLHVLAAKRHAPDEIVLANRSVSRLRFALERGVVNASQVEVVDETLGDRLQERTTGRGFDQLIIALAGSAGPRVTEQLLPYAVDGAEVCLFGGFSGVEPLALAGAGDLDCQALRNAAERVERRLADGRLLVFFGSRGSGRKHYELARDLVLSSRISVRPLIRASIALPQLPALVDELRHQELGDQQTGGRVVVVCDQSDGGCVDT